MLPWECEDCGHKLQDSSFITYLGCPKCGSENFFHGNSILIDSDVEEFNIYDDE